MKIRKNPKIKNRDINNLRPRITQYSGASCRVVRSYSIVQIYFIKTRSAKQPQPAVTSNKGGQQQQPKRTTTQTATRESRVMIELALVIVKPPGSP